MKHQYGKEGYEKRRKRLLRAYIKDGRTGLDKEINKQAQARLKEKVIDEIKKRRGL